MEHRNDSSGTDAVGDYGSSRYVTYNTDGSISSFVPIIMKSNIDRSGDKYIENFNFHNTQKPIDSSIKLDYVNTALNLKSSSIPSTSDFVKPVALEGSIGLSNNDLIMPLSYHNMDDNRCNTAMTNLFSNTTRHIDDIHGNMHTTSVANQVNSANSNVIMYYGDKLVDDMKQDYQQNTLDSPKRARRARGKVSDASKINITPTTSGNNNKDDLNKEQSTIKPKRKYTRRANKVKLEQTESFNANFTYRSNPTILSSFDTPSASKQRAVTKKGKSLFPVNSVQNECITSANKQCMYSEQKPDVNILERTSQVDNPEMEYIHKRIQMDSFTNMQDTNRLQQIHANLTQKEQKSNIIMQFASIDSKIGEIITEQLNTSFYDNVNLGPIYNSASLNNQPIQNETPSTFTDNNSVLQMSQGNNLTNELSGALNLQMHNASFMNRNMNQDEQVNKGDVIIGDASNIDGFANQSKVSKSKTPVRNSKTGQLTNRQKQNTNDCGNDGIKQTRKRTPRKSCTVQQLEIADKEELPLNLQLQQDDSVNEKKVVKSRKQKKDSDKQITHDNKIIDNCLVNVVPSECTTTVTDGANKPRSRRLKSCIKNIDLERDASIEQKSLNIDVVTKFDQTNETSGNLLESEKLNIINDTTKLDQQHEIDLRGNTEQTVIPHYTTSILTPLRDRKSKPRQYGASRKVPKNIGQNLKLENLEDIESQPVGYPLVNPNIDGIINDNTEFNLSNNEDTSKLLEINSSDNCVSSTIDKNLGEQSPTLKPAKLDVDVIFDEQSPIQMETPKGRKSLLEQLESQTDKKGKPGRKPKATTNNTNENDEKAEILQPKKRGRATAAKAPKQKAATVPRRPYTRRSKIANTTDNNVVSNENVVNSNQNVITTTRPKRKYTRRKNISESKNLELDSVVYGAEAETSVTTTCVLNVVEAPVDTVAAIGDNIIKDNVTSAAQISAVRKGRTVRRRQCIRKVKPCDNEANVLQENTVVNSIGISNSVKNSYLYNDAFVNKDKKVETANISVSETSNISDQIITKSYLFNTSFDNEIKSVIQHCGSNKSMELSFNNNFNENQLNTKDEFPARINKFTEMPQERIEFQQNNDNYVQQNFNESDQRQTAEKFVIHSDTLSYQNVMPDQFAMKAVTTEHQTIIPVQLPVVDAVGCRSIIHEQFDMHRGTSDYERGIIDQFAQSNSVKHQTVIPQQFATNGSISNHQEPILNHFVNSTNHQTEVPQQFGINGSMSNYQKPILNKFVDSVEHQTAITEHFDINIASNYDTTIHNQFTATDVNKHQTVIPRQFMSSSAPNYREAMLDQVFVSDAAEHRTEISEPFGINGNASNYDPILNRFAIVNEHQTVIPRQFDVDDSASNYREPIIDQFSMSEPTEYQIPVPEQFAINDYASNYNAPVLDQFVATDAQRGIPGQFNISNNKSSYQKSVIDQFVVPDSTERGIAIPEQFGRNGNISDYRTVIFNQYDMSDADEYQTVISRQYAITDSMSNYQEAIPSRFVTNEESEHDMIPGQFAVDDGFDLQPVIPEQAVIDNRLIFDYQREMMEKNTAFNSDFGKEVNAQFPIYDEIISNNLINTEYEVVCHYAISKHAQSCNSVSLIRGSIFTSSEKPRYYSTNYDNERSDTFRKNITVNTEVPIGPRTNAIVTTQNLTRHDNYFISYENTHFNHFYNDVKRCSTKLVFYKDYIKQATALYSNVGHLSNHSQMLSTMTCAEQDTIYTVNPETEDIAYDRGSIEISPVSDAQNNREIIEDVNFAVNNNNLKSGKSNVGLNHIDSELINQSDCDINIDNASGNAVDDFDVSTNTSTEINECMQPETGNKVGIQELANLDDIDAKLAEIKYRTITLSDDLQEIAKNYSKQGKPCDYIIQLSEMLKNEVASSDEIVKNSVFYELLKSVNEDTSFTVPVDGIQVIELDEKDILNDEMIKTKSCSNELDKNITELSKSNDDTKILRRLELNNTADVLKSLSENAKYMDKHKTKFKTKLENVTKISSKYNENTVEIRNKLKQLNKMKMHLTAVLKSMIYGKTVLEHIELNRAKDHNKASVKLSAKNTNKKEMVSLKICKQKEALYPLLEKKMMKRPIIYSGKTVVTQMESGKQTSETNLEMESANTMVSNNELDDQPDEEFQVKNCWEFIKKEKAKQKLNKKKECKDVIKSVSNNSKVQNMERRRTIYKNALKKKRSKTKADIRKEIAANMVQIFRMKSKLNKQISESFKTKLEDKILKLMIYVSELKSKYAFKVEQKRQRNVASDHPFKIFLESMYKRIMKEYNDKLQTQFEAGESAICKMDANMEQQLKSKIKEKAKIIFENERKKKEAFWNTLQNLSFRLQLSSTSEPELVIKVELDTEFFIKSIITVRTNWKSFSSTDLLPLLRAQLVSNKKCGHVYKKELVVKCLEQEEYVSCPAKNCGIKFSKNDVSIKLKVFDGIKMLHKSYKSDITTASKMVVSPVINIKTFKETVSVTELETTLMDNFVTNRMCGHSYIRKSVVQYFQGKKCMPCPIKNCDCVSFTLKDLRVAVNQLNIQGPVEILTALETEIDHSFEDITIIDDQSEVSIELNNCTDKRSEKIILVKNKICNHSYDRKFILKYLQNGSKPCPVANCSCKSFNMLDIDGDLTPLIKKITNKKIKINPPILPKSTSEISETIIEPVSPVNEIIPNEDVSALNVPDEHDLEYRKESVPDYSNSLRKTLQSCVEDALKVAKINNLVKRNYQNNHYMIRHSFDDFVTMPSALLADDVTDYYVLNNLCGHYYTWKMISNYFNDGPSIRCPVTNCFLKSFTIDDLIRIIRPCDKDYDDDDDDEIVQDDTSVENDRSLSFNPSGNYQKMPEKTNNYNADRQHNDDYLHIKSGHSYKKQAILKYFSRKENLHQNTQNVVDIASNKINNCKMTTMNHHHHQQSVTSRKVDMSMFNVKCGHYYNKEAIMIYLNGKITAPCPFPDCHCKSFTESDLIDSAQDNNGNNNNNSNDAECLNNSNHDTMDSYKTNMERPSTDTESRQLTENLQKLEEESNYFNDEYGGHSYKINKIMKYLSKKEHSKSGKVNSEKSDDRKGTTNIIGTAMEVKTSTPSITRMSPPSSNSIKQNASIRLNIVADDSTATNVNNVTVVEDNSSSSSNSKVEVSVIKDGRKLKDRINDVINETKVLSNCKNAKTDTKTCSTLEEEDDDDNNEKNSHNDNNEKGIIEILNNNTAEINKAEVSVIKDGRLLMKNVGIGVVDKNNEKDGIYTEKNDRKNYNDHNESSISDVKINMDHNYNKQVNSTVVSINDGDDEIDKNNQANSNHLKNDDKNIHVEIPTITTTTNNNNPLLMNSGCINTKKLNLMQNQNSCSKSVSDKMSTEQTTTESNDSDETSTSSDNTNGKHNTSEENKHTTTTTTTIDAAGSSNGKCDGSCNDNDNDNNDNNDNNNDDNNDNNKMNSNKDNENKESDDTKKINSDSISTTNSSVYGNQSSSNNGDENDENYNDDDKNRNGRKPIENSAAAAAAAAKCDIEESDDDDERQPSSFSETIDTSLPTISDGYKFKLTMRYNRVLTTKLLDAVYASIVVNNSCGHHYVKNRLLAGMKNKHSVQCPIQNCTAVFSLADLYAKYGPVFVYGSIYLEGEHEPPSGRFNLITVTVQKERKMIKLMENNTLWIQTKMNDSPLESVKYVKNTACGHIYKRHIVDYFKLRNTIGCPFLGCSCQSFTVSQLKDINKQQSVPPVSSPPSLLLRPSSLDPGIASTSYLKTRPKKNQDNKNDNKKRHQICRVTTTKVGSSGGGSSSRIVDIRNDVEIFKFCTVDTSLGIDTQSQIVIMVDKQRKTGIGSRPKCIGTLQTENSVTMGAEIKIKTNKKILTKAEVKNIIKSDYVRNLICGHHYRKDAAYKYLKEEEYRPCPVDGCFCKKFSLKDLSEKRNKMDVPGMREKLASFKI